MNMKKKSPEVNSDFFFRGKTAVRLQYLQGIRGIRSAHSPSDRYVRDVRVRVRAGQSISEVP